MGIRSWVPTSTHIFDWPRFVRGFFLPDQPNASRRPEQFA
jgi:hypothetical protein